MWHCFQFWVGFSVATSCVLFYVPPPPFPFFLNSMRMNLWTCSSNPTLSLPLYDSTSCSSLWIDGFFALLTLDHFGVFFLWLFENALTIAWLPQLFFQLFNNFQNSLPVLLYRRCNWSDAAPFLSTLQIPKFCFLPCWRPLRAAQLASFTWGF